MIIFLYKIFNCRKFNAIKLYTIKNHINKFSRTIFGHQSIVLIKNIITQNYKTECFLY